MNGRKITAVIADNFFSLCQKCEKCPSALLKGVVPEQDKASVPAYSTFLTSSNFHLFGFMKELMGGQNRTCLPALSSEDLATVWFMKPGH
jgi:hypothetical protein